MPVRREQVAAALKYLGDKADVKRRYERMVSLDQPQDADAIDMALEMGGSLVPGVGPALAARDFERARRADDKAGMAMAGASALPLGKLIGALKGYDPVMREIDVYHGNPRQIVDKFNKLGEEETKFVNKRLEKESDAGNYETFQTAQSLDDIDVDFSPVALRAKAELLKQLGQEAGLKTSIEGSNLSASQYVKFYKELDDGEIDFKVRISDHPDVSKNSPYWEDKAFDLNPDSGTSISEVAELLKNEQALKRKVRPF